jgi:hypothetical protein
MMVKRLKAITRDESVSSQGMQRRMRQKIAELLKAAGARHVVNALPGIPGGAAAGHVMGATRMGSDLQHSVLDEFCRAHDTPNLIPGRQQCVSDFRGTESDPHHFRARLPDGGPHYHPLVA